LQLGYIAKQLGIKFAVPSFSGITTEHLVSLAQAHGLSANGKVKLYDGKTGELFDRDVTV
jgi:DNA-directed RNA polymerase subunit beta